MPESYGGRLAKYLPADAPLPQDIMQRSYALPAQAAQMNSDASSAGRTLWTGGRPSFQPPANSHAMMPEAQKQLFTQLKQLFDRTTEESGGSNVLSKLGALIINPGEINHYSTRLNAVGLTFGDKYLAEGASPSETNMLKESELDPITARGHIALGPDALSGEWEDSLFHELAHKAIKSLTPNMDNSDQELLIRSLMIKEGKNVEENKRWLAQNFKGSSPELHAQRGQALLSELEDKAKGKIKDLIQKPQWHD